MSPGKREDPEITPPEPWAWSFREVLMWVIVGLLAVGGVVWLIADLAMAGIAMVASLGVLGFGLGIGWLIARSERASSDG
jgi:hypothetical protein